MKYKVDTQKRYLDEQDVDHLGGHLNRTNTDEPLLRYVKERFKIETMLDIGCGFWWYERS